MPDVEIFDIAGLTDPVIARTPGEHYRKKLRNEYLATRAPEALLITSRRPPRTGGVSLPVYYPAEEHVLGPEWSRSNYS